MPARHWARNTGGAAREHLENAATFAFYPNKQITTGEGGMIVTNDEALQSFAAACGTRGAAKTHRGLSHARLGYNYRLSEIQCALGIAQLERVTELLAARERVAALYHKVYVRHFPPDSPAWLQGHQAKLVCIRRAA